MTPLWVQYVYWFAQKNVEYVNVTVTPCSNYAFLLPDPAQVKEHNFLFTLGWRLLQEESFLNSQIF